MHYQWGFPKISKMGWVKVFPPCGTDRKKKLRIPQATDFIYGGVQLVMGVPLYRWMAYNGHSYWNGSGSHGVSILRVQWLGWLGGYPSDLEKLSIFGDWRLMRRWNPWLSIYNVFGFHDIWWILKWGICPLVNYGPGPMDSGFTHEKMWLIFHSFLYV